MVLSCSDVSVFGGAGSGYAFPAFSYNSNQGFGFGDIYGNGSSSFYYPWYNYNVPEQIAEESIERARESAKNNGAFIIEMNRILESQKATVSKFYAYGPTPLKPFSLSGYIIEPGGSSTTNRKKSR